MKIETYLPVFSGFYNTLFDDDNLIDTLESINNERENKGLKLLDNTEDFEVNWKQLHTNVAKLCCEWVQQELNSLGFNTNVVFQALIDGKCYQYSDSINIEIELDTTPFFEYLSENKKEFSKSLKKHYTGYDGFIPSHSNDVNDWSVDYIIEKSGHRIGSCLDFILNNEDDDAELEMYSYVQEQGGFNTEVINYDELLTI